MGLREGEEEREGERERRGREKGKRGRGGGGRRGWMFRMESRFLLNIAFKESLTN